MIISASRRTDIPAFYTDWFFQRLQEGFVCVQNPFQPKNISRIILNPDVVDCIVFWTKNPIPMLPRLSELAPYPFLFQFTLTPYGKDLEFGLPDKEKILIPAFQTLAQTIGPQRIIWRYDPIVFTEIYTPKWHLERFCHYARLLYGFSECVVISFLDLYAKTKRNFQGIQLKEPDSGDLLSFASSLCTCARSYGMTMQSCAEKIDLHTCGIEHGACLDKALLERVIGAPLRLSKDSGQRDACLCAESIDIGAYDTCINGCRYCYANASTAAISRHRKDYDPASPILCHKLTSQDIIRDRRCASVRDIQYRFFEP